MLSEDGTLEWWVAWKCKAQIYIILLICDENGNEINYKDSNNRLDLAPTCYKCEIQ
jgi:hypothetical protein